MLHHIVRIALALTASLASTTAAQNLDRRRAAVLVDSIVREMQTRRHVPGVSVLVAQRGQPLVVKGYGVADLDDDAPASPHSVYAIASITKQFTAAAILLLAQEHKLQLEDDISKYLSDLPMVRGAVTLRQLLHQTTGIPSAGPLGDRYWDRRDYTREEWLNALAEFYKTRAEEFVPGTAWSYGNMNYILLGMVIEKITGRSLWDVFRDRFFLPLRMTSTAQCNPGVVVKQRAKGYVADSNAPMGVIPAPYVTPTVSLGNSGLCSNVLDLLKWQRALVEGRVLDPASYAMMTTPGSLSDGTPTDYAMGVVEWPLGKEKFTFHTGGAVGFTSFLGYLPGNDATVIVMANGNADPLRIGTELVRIARGWPLVKGMAMSRREMERYVGTYEGSHVTAIVQEANGELEADVSGTPSIRFLFPVRLLKRGENDFVVGWEPESHVRFHVSGDRADSAAWSYGDRTVQLSRTR